MEYLAFYLAVAFTIGASFVCSLLEALILSTTAAEVESLKKRKPRKGEKLEAMTTDLPNTISAILTLNTIANTAGAATVGFLAAALFGNAYLGLISGLLTIGILIFSEVIPKNLGVVYRVQLQPWVVTPLQVLKTVLSPITYLTNLSVKLVVRNDGQSEDTATDEEEIILLAEAGAKKGTITSGESDMVTNTLKLDDVLVSEIMTPRVVVRAMNREQTVGEVLQDTPNIPFARIPVYEEEIDNIIGIVRRRDILKKKAEDLDNTPVSDFMDAATFIPETVTGYSALQTMLKTHHQLLAVVDEFGSLAGVVSMEDIMEYIIGREIFEKDDVAIDMRELARSEGRKTTEALESETSGSGI